MDERAACPLVLPVCLVHYLAERVNWNKVCVGGGEGKGKRVEYRGTSCVLSGDGPSLIYEHLISMLYDC